jgi:hypothetical protein
VSRRRPDKTPMCDETVVSCFRRIGATLVPMEFDRPSHPVVLESRNTPLESNARMASEDSADEAAKVTFV